MTNIATYIKRILPEIKATPVDNPPTEADIIYEKIVVHLTILVALPLIFGFDTGRFINRFWELWWRNENSLLSIYMGIYMSIINHKK